MVVLNLPLGDWVEPTVKTVQIGPLKKQITAWIKKRKKKAFEFCALWESAAASRAGTVPLF